MLKGLEKILDYEKRFGHFAVERGFITFDDLIEALSVQVREEMEKGSHRLIGQILFEQNKLTGAQLQEVIDAALLSN